MDMQNRWLRSVAGLCLGLLAAAPPALAQGYKELEKQVVEKVLPNGLRLLVLPRPGSPTVSMVTYADVGSANENQNATGLAHIFEHMAFKGTTTIGTKDAAKEALAIKKVDQAFLALREERLRRPRPDEAKLKQLEAAFVGARDEAQQYVEVNELGKILEQEGAQGLNAFTNFDQTVYHYSLPANKLELWAATEADRFSNPVLREFYKEKDVIMEERRMGESQPTRRLLDDFMAVAFKAHMYRNFIIGHMSDLQGISRGEAEAWFNKFYRAKNLTCAVVGDVDVKTTLPMLEKYLGSIPTGEKPPLNVTVEPEQRTEKRMTMEDASQPLVIYGYHRPDVNDPDAAAYTVLADVMGGGRSSRLNTSLVKDKQIALAAGTLANLGDKYPGLFLVFAVPNKGKTNADCEAAIQVEEERLKKEPISEEELAGVKARAKVRLIGTLDNNTGLAIALTSAQNVRGDWRKTFTLLDELDKVTPADVQRVAQKLFVKSNRTIGAIENAKPAAR